MKNLVLFFLAVITLSCEYATLQYGYYWNPINVLEHANEAIKNNDQDALSEVLSRNALCNYASEDGIVHIKSSLKKLSSELAEPKLVAKKYLKSPDYNGFWVYYQESYVAKAFTHQNKLALEVKIVCDFGASNSDSRLLNASVDKYGVRSCSIVKVNDYISPRNIDVCRDI
jgi:hypothetical protein